MFNFLFSIVNYIFVGVSVSPHLKMGVLDTQDFYKNMEKGEKEYEKNKKNI